MRYFLIDLIVEDVPIDTSSFLCILNLMHADFELPKEMLNCKVFKIV